MNNKQTNFEQPAAIVNLLSSSDEEDSNSAIKKANDHKNADLPSKMSKSSNKNQLATKVTDPTQKRKVFYSLTFQCIIHFCINFKIVEWLSKN